MTIKIMRDFDIFEKVLEGSTVQEVGKEYEISKSSVERALRVMGNRIWVYMHGKDRSLPGDIYLDSSANGLKEDRRRWRAALAEYKQHWLTQGEADSDNQQQEGSHEQ